MQKKNEDISGFRLFVIIVFKPVNAPNVLMEYKKPTLSPNSIFFHKTLEACHYVHITSPIRRIVDIVNQIFVESFVKSSSNFDKNSSVRHFGMMNCYSSPS